MGPEPPGPPAGVAHAATSARIARRKTGLGTEVPCGRTLRVGVMRPPFDSTRRSGVKFSV